MRSPGSLGKSGAASRLRLSFVRGAGGTELAGLHQETPLRALFPRPTVEGLPEAVLVTTSGGLVGGDRLEIECNSGRDTTVLITSQAAEKVYRSAGPEVAIAARLDAGEGAWLEWLPQETILFDGARLSRRTELHVAASARLLAADIVVFGRHAHGETLTNGRLIDNWRVHMDGRLVWADALRLDGNLGRHLRAPFALAGARAMAMLICVAADAGAWLNDARAALASTPGRSGCTALPGVMLVRWLSDDPAALRRQVIDLAVHLRHAIVGLPARAPTTWWT